MLANKVQLITYVDRLSGGGFAQLGSLLNGPLQGLFGGVHALPFFETIDAEDAGFDPIDHTTVDHRLGSWEDVRKLATQYELMADLIVNHVSSDSPQFNDYRQHGEASAYAGMFLRYRDIFPNGASEQDLLTIYRPRPGLPFTRINFPNKRSELLWTTFTSKQIDINVAHPEGSNYLNTIIKRFHASGIKMIRLDAIGYAVKRAGSSCFMTPETYTYIDTLAHNAHQHGIEVLVEIHSHYQQQIEIAKQVDRVYDFALPPLVLHTLYSSDTAALKRWLAISPRNCITVLDTHDGIGIIDVAPHGALPGLLNAQQTSSLVEEIHRRSGGESRLSTGTAANNLDIYQVNCTIYSALGRDDHDYLLARLIQLACPGIPQIYYVGLLAGENDMTLLQKTKVGRDVNRHYYNQQEISEQCQRPVVQQLFALIRLRNNHPAFNGKFTLLESAANTLSIHWSGSDAELTIQIDFSNRSFQLQSRIHAEEQLISHWDQLHTFHTQSPYLESQQRLHSV